MSEMYIPYEAKKIKKLNDKIEKEQGGTLYWDFEEATRRILHNMKEEAGMDPLRWQPMAIFLALRFKFVDEKTRKLVYEALCFNRKHYNETIDGSEPIYKSMQEGLDYYSAIFAQYKNTDHAKESNLPSKVLIPDVWPGERIKTEFIHPTEDGKHLIYLTKEEYHQRYGLSKIEEINQSPSKEWLDNFNAYNDIYNDEINKYELKYKKDFRKWNKKQKDEFHKHI